MAPRLIHFQHHASDTEGQDAIAWEIEIEHGIND